MRLNPVMKINFTFLYIFFCSFTQAQSDNQLNELGSFTNATSIVLNDLGDIFVADKGNNTILKLNREGEILNSIGGFGWETSTFDYPIDLATKNLALYVADKNNHRIQILDRDLNFIGEISSTNKENITYNYPVAVDVTQQGDIFILDSESERILKFDANGNLSAIVGDYDSGEFALQNPTDILVTENNYLIVSATDEIFVFDIFGNGIVHFPLSFEVNKVKSKGAEVVLLTSGSIYVMENYLTKIPQITKIYDASEGNELITDAAFTGEEILILIPQKIIVKPLFSDTSK